MQSKPWKVANDMNDVEHDHCRRCGEGYQRQLSSLREEIKHRWIPVSEKLPKMREVEKGASQSSWVHITDGVRVIEAYYYDYTQREPKPNYATGKGWYCHGMKRSDITHWKPIILP